MPRTTGSGKGTLPGAASAALALALERLEVGAPIVIVTDTPERADGLHFVGLDVVDGHLTEVNVTSPTGIRQLVALSGTRPDLHMIRWIERRVGAAAE